MPRAPRRRVTEFSDNGNEAAAHWHLNRGIPVVWLIGSIMIGSAQFVGAVWWASQFNTRVDIIEKTVALMAPQGDRLTRLEEKMVALQVTTNRIETLLVAAKK